MTNNVYGFNSGMDIMQVTWHFLFGFKASSIEGKHAWYFKYVQEPVIRDSIGLRNEFTIILLSGHIGNSILNYISILIYSQIS